MSAMTDTTAESGLAFPCVDQAAWESPALAEYPAPPVDAREALRYTGFPRNIALPDEVLQLEARAEALAQGVLTYRVSFAAGPVSWDGEYPVLPFAQQSANLARNLRGCTAAVVFAATVGAGIDRLIRRYEKTDAALAMMLQGLGAERVEALCGAFSADVRTAAQAQGFRTHSRYSPGYGDLPITVQPDVLRLVDAERRLGITLSPAYLMAPSKSVTAVIGLEPESGGEASGRAAACSGGGAA